VLLDSRRRSFLFIALCDDEVGFDALSDSELLRALALPLVVECSRDVLRSEIGLKAIGNVFCLCNGNSTRFVCGAALITDLERE